MTHTTDHARRILERIKHPTVLREHGLTIGVIEIAGAGQRVATWDGYESRHMSAAAARRFAADLIAGEHSRSLKPVHDALMAAVERIEAET